MPNSLQKRNNYWWVLWSLLIIAFTLLMLRIVLPYTSWRIDIDFLLTKEYVLFGESDTQKILYLGSFYLHIFSSVLVLLAGATQFVKKWMYSPWHRMVGKAYVGIILGVSGPAALVMSVFANGNDLSRIGFFILTCLWWFFTWKAYVSIRKVKLTEHVQWMLRSYALTLSAITLRSYIFLIYYFNLLPGFSEREVYIILSYISWVPNLLLIEFLIQKNMPNICWAHQKLHKL